MTGADFGPSAVMADLKANKQLAVYTIGAWCCSENPTP